MGMEWGPQEPLGPKTALVIIILFLLVFAWATWGGR